MCLVIQLAFSATMGACPRSRPSTVRPARLRTTRLSGRIGPGVLQGTKYSRLWHGVKRVFCGMLVSSCTLDCRRVGMAIRFSDAIDVNWLALIPRVEKAYFLWSHTGAKNRGVSPLTSSLKSTTSHPISFDNHDGIKQHVVHEKSKQEEGTATITQEGLLMPNVCCLSIKGRPRCTLKNIYLTALRHTKTLSQ